MRSRLFRFVFVFCFCSAFAFPKSAFTQTGARTAIRNGVLQNAIDYAGYNAINVGSTGGLDVTVDQNGTVTNVLPTNFPTGHLEINGVAVDSTLAGKQPLDADLTAIAALTTDPFGRALLTKTSAGTVRSYIGGTTLASWDITDGQPLDADLTAIAALTTDPFGRALLTKTSAGTVRSYIGGTTLASWDITDGQPLDADLTAIAALSTTSYGRSFLTFADGTAAIAAIGKTTVDGYNITDAVKSIQLTTPGVLFTSPVTWSVTGGAATASLTQATAPAGTVFGNFAGGAAAPGFSATPSFSGINITALTAGNITASTTVGRNLLNLTNPGQLAFLKIDATNAAFAENAATMRSDLALVPGTNIEAWDADLDAIAALAGTSGFLKKTGANTWSLDTSTYLTANQTITITGDASGSGTTAITLTLSNIPTATTMAGSVLATAIAAPSTPAAGKGSIYVDSTSKNIAVKDDAGVVKHGVQTKAAVTSNFVTAINDAGQVTAAQPAFSDISGSVAPGQLPNPAASTLGGVESKAAVSHQWLNTISTSGVPGATQPDYGDLTGTPTLPANTNSTASQWFNSYNSATGAFGKAQPTFTDLSAHPTTLSGYGITDAALSLVPTAVKTSSYTAAPADLVPVDTTSGAATVTLPTAPADKSVVAIKHVIQGGTNAVTINCGGSDVFNKTGGGASLTLSLLNQAVILQYKSSGAIWYVLADDLSLAVLDARFATVAQGTKADNVGAVNGLVKSNGSATFSSATQGTDYYKPGGTGVSVADGGTGLSSYTIGDILYASASGTLSKLADVATGQVLKSGGVGVAPVWGTIASSFLSDASNVPLLNAANVFTTSNTVNVALAANTSGIGLALSNTIAASSGNQEYSPEVRWKGQGWGTTTPASSNVDFRAYVLPVQGTTNPTGKWTLESRVGAAAFANPLTIDTAGFLSAVAIGPHAVTFSNAISSPVEGATQAFTDSTTNTWGATITGGGSNHVLGYYDGTNWTVMGK
jgi:hypothetical protein